MAIVNTNYNSVFGSVQLAQIQRAISQATVRISSGSKLNNAGDNPSGVIAASWFKARISGIGQAEFNAGDVESMLNVAKSAMDEINNYLIDMRDLALQAANDATLTPAQMADLDIEFQGYMGDAQNVADNTEYNGINLLDGTYGAKNAQVGPGGADNVTITLGAVSGFIGALAGQDITNAVNAGNAITALDTAMGNIATAQAQVGTSLNEMSVRLTGLGNQEVNMASAYSNIADADMASEISKFAKLQILAQSTTAVLAQANYVPQRIIDILDKL